MFLNDQNKEDFTIIVVPLFLYKLRYLCTDERVLSIRKRFREFRGKSTPPNVLGIFFLFFRNRNYDNSDMILYLDNFLYMVIFSLHTHTPETTLFVSLRFFSDDIHQK